MPLFANLLHPPKTNEHTLPKTDIAPTRRPGPKRKLIFQPKCFRCYVSQPESAVLTSQVVSGISTNRRDHLALLQHVGNVSTNTIHFHDRIAWPGTFPWGVTHLLSLPISTGYSCRHWKLTWLAGKKQPWMKMYSVFYQKWWFSRVIFVFGGVYLWKNKFVKLGVHIFWFVLLSNSWYFTLGEPWNKRCFLYKLRLADVNIICPDLGKQNGCISEINMEPQQKLSR